ncbi:MAG: prepilin-type N-terminal cleavage/methylation domain-containing protein [Gammaproteobacteria bacterium]|nr:prepilin-type N-terminal cleavage/methylation domain-containing protein [Gammaproteobacteria bacterium]MCP5138302.1 prepilin-type N-terminal cleavage/methylation domain-containing protein [Chromatiales bacterium]
MRRAPACGTGFTLVELMIVMVIMAILTSASVAGYRQYVRRANRTDATTALLRLSAAEERFYLQNNRYATTADELGDPPPAGLGLGGTEHGLYDLSVEPAADGAVVGYIATATARPDQSQRDDANCASFSIDQSGQRTATNSDGVSNGEISSTCWR